MTWNSQHDQSFSSGAPRWEYKVTQVDLGGILFGPHIESDELSQILNERGAQGWELVNTFDINVREGRTSFL